MPRRGENIRKRKDGRWEGRVKRRDELTGAVRYHSVYGKSYREVKTRIGGLAEQTPLKAPAPKEQTFEEVLDLWLLGNRVRLKGGTVNKYQYLIETHIVPALGAVGIRSLTAGMINAFLLHELEHGRLDGEGGLAPSYVRTMMLVIKSAQQFAAEQGFCAPLSGAVYTPSIPKRDCQVLAKAEQHLLEDHIRLEPPNIMAGICLSLHAGLRIGEICALAREDVDLENKLLHVRHTIARVPAQDRQHRLIVDTPKTKASFRVVPISSTLYDVLAPVRQAAVSSYVVSKHPRGFMSPRTFEYQFHQVLRRASLRDIPFHALRHTFATRCIEVGVDVKTLSEILGHSNASITLNTYVHSSMDLKRVQMEKLCDRFFDGQRKW